MSVLAKTHNNIIETVMVKGDLSQLTATERNAYYLKMCEVIGLNPVTRPLEYITLNGKLTLYARKDCTDQLRAIHKISVTDLSESERDGVFVVTAKVANAEGRTDVSKGAVNISNLKGEALANALMKAETKAKRRATLSICGLGVLDETEVEDINPAHKAPPSQPRHDDPPAIVKPPGPHKIDPLPGDTFDAWRDRFTALVRQAQTLDEVAAWEALNSEVIQNKIRQHAKGGPIYEAIRNAIDQTRDRIAFPGVVNVQQSEGVHQNPPAVARGVPSWATTVKATQAPKSAPEPSSEVRRATVKPGVTITNIEGFIKDAGKRYKAAKDVDELILVHERDVEPNMGGLFPTDCEEILRMFRLREAELTP